MSRPPYPRPKPLSRPNPSDPVPSERGFVHKPQRHHCRPGCTPYVITDPDIPELNGRIGLRPPEVGTPDGSVWQCECGKTWVAYYPEYTNCIVFSPSFRPEGRIERWRRERLSGGTKRKNPIGFHRQDRS